MGKTQAEGEWRTDPTSQLPRIDIVESPLPKMSSKERNFPGEKCSWSRYIEAADVPQLTFNPDFTGSFEYLGRRDFETLLDRAVDYCHNTAGMVGDVQLPLKAFFEHVHSRYMQPQHTALWFSLRVSKPDREFDLAQWHIDGEYFTRADPNAEPAFKVAATIAGPATWFLRSYSYFPDYLETPTSIIKFHENRVKPHEFEIARWVRKSEYEHWEDHLYDPKPGELDENGNYKMDTSSPEYAEHIRRHTEFYWITFRKRLEQFLASFPASSPPVGQAACWDVGEDGAVHSEPAFTTHRLFVSVLPGTDTEIREMCEKEGREFGVGREEVYGQNLRVEHYHISRLLRSS